MSVSHKQALQIAKESRRAQLKIFPGSRSCVSAVAISLRVARYFGVKARPQAVSLAIWNDHHSLGTPGTGELNHDANSWDGHLVLLLDDAWLADVSADQFDRPDKQLRVTEPIVVPWTDIVAVPWEGGSTDLQVVFEHPDLGWKVAYRPVNDLAWRDFADWRKYTKMHQKCAGIAIRAIRATEEGERS